ncbi:MAG: response regulator transcription factor [Rhodobacteraceae bacterium]|nr:response regulator transcription factor [Paracoccaceae bacterium]
MAEDRGPILVVEDDADIASALSRGLALHGYATICEPRVERALDLVRTAPLRAAIVDVMLGPDSGLTLVRDARAAGFRKPILMLSALSEVGDRSEGLGAGADDYIVKPFSFEELLARLQVQERRVEERAAMPGFDPAARTLQGRGVRVELTEREANLLAMLYRNAGRILPRGVIFDTLWAGEGTSSDNIVDVYVGYLRKKLSPAEAFGIDIQTVRNRGFMLVRLDTRSA